MKGKTIDKIIKQIPLEQKNVYTYSFQATSGAYLDIKDNMDLPKSDKLYFFVGDNIPREKTKIISQPISYVLKDKGVKDYDVVIAIECIRLKPGSRLSFSKIEDKLREYIDEGADNFYKVDVLDREHDYNKFTALFIKIPICQEYSGNNPNIVQVDGVWYDITNLLTYLTIADSRTYKNVVYNTPQFKADASERLPDIKVDWAQNMLVHGAPGTGKSFTVNKKAKEGFGKNVRRVTFFEDYSYEKFVGAYMPVEDDKITELSFDDKKGCSKSKGIAYKFKPGVMANILAEAYAELIVAKNKNYYAKHKTDELNGIAKDETLSLDELYKIDDGDVIPQKFCLIVEEINRAPAASVFGDFFQLLDREDNGLSTYSICVSDEFKEWFVDKVTELCNNSYVPSEDNVNYSEINRETAELVADNLKLPPNLYIWTTMNSADQGVFPLDTAFKRRWSYLYLSVDKNRAGTENEPKRNIKIPYNGAIQEVDWDVFRNAINNAMQDAGCIEEDRLIGTWYFNNNDFAANDKLFDENPTNRYSMINPLCDKLFAYLRNDVFRNNPKSFFNEDCSTMSKIRRDIVNGEGLDKILRNFSIDEKYLYSVSSNDSTTPQTDSQVTSESEE